MKILSFNCRGLASPTKKSSLKRLIAVHNPDVLFLQETMGLSEVVIRSLEALLLGWSFVVLDARGHSGGLAMGWRLKRSRCDNAWGFDSGLRLLLFSAELGRTVVLINVYRPYTDRKRFWDSLASFPWLSQAGIILGGDLNFSLGAMKVWGPRSSLDPLTDYFTHLLDTLGLLDLSLAKLQPTWRNLRTGDARVSKCLDRFLLTEDLVDSLGLV
jgi:exonuclease III